ncbi:glycosyltransferase [Derxia gummosa]|uniref:Glycosyltransferase n=1 Tax=Derxia gummosa DSM 723 TaxID=1121388 RepID=A0A8B6XCS2_9BURK|nr:glycosyltransferase [Derxia gummosa]
MPDAVRNTAPASEADRHPAPGAVDGDTRHADDRPASDYKIAVYLPDIRVGGAELSLIRLARGMARRGPQVVLVVHDTHPDTLHLAAGLEVVSLDVKRTFAAVRQLARFIAIEKPDVLLSGLPHNNLAAVAARKLARSKCRLVLTEHAPISNQIRAEGGWRFRMLPTLIRRGYPLADAVVAVSRGVQLDLTAMIAPQFRARLIFNPIIPEDVADLCAEPIDHPWLDRERYDTVLFVGRLSREKRVLTLVRAFNRARRRRPRLRLLIAGDGPDRERIVQMIERLDLDEKVRLVGNIENPFAWMHRCKVFVLPSLFEGFGNVLVEAMAAGTHVISTDCPVGPREILQGGKFGTLVPMGDIEAMRRAITHAVDRDALPEGATEHAMGFTEDRAVSRYLALFEQLMFGRTLPPRAGGAA